MKKLEAAYPDENDRFRRLGKALTSVGEALFFFAEVKKKDVDKVKFPEYKGSGERADVMKHIQTKVADWVKKKRQVIEDADKEYQKIVTLQPTPPPRWVIAAGSRVGQMWSRFVAEFRAAPIPKEWNQKVRTRSSRTSTGRTSSSTTTRRSTRRASPRSSRPRRRSRPASTSP